MGNHAEDIQKHVRTYLVVFAALAGLTAVTVAISYLHLATPAAVTLALMVAIVKGSLVALFFMHLITEEKAIYYLLGLTASFFVVLMYMPSGWWADGVTVNQVWDKLPAEGVTAHTTGAHAATEGGHGAHEGGEGGHH